MARKVKVYPALLLSPDGSFDRNGPVSPSVGAGVTTEPELYGNGWRFTNGVANNQVTLNNVTIPGVEYTIIARIRWDAPDANNFYYFSWGGTAQAMGRISFASPVFRVGADEYSMGVGGFVNGQRFVQAGSVGPLGKRIFLNGQFQTTRPQSAPAFTGNVFRLYASGSATNSVVVESILMYPFQLSDADIIRISNLSARWTMSNTRVEISIPDPAFHLPLNGNLNGQSPDGPILADGYGALRWRVSDLSGRSCALVEVGATNYTSNPFGIDPVSFGWTTVTGFTRAQESLTGRPLEGPFAGPISAAVSHTNTSGAQLSGSVAATSQRSVPNEGRYTAQAFVWLPSDNGLTSARLAVLNFTGAGAGPQVLVNMALRDQWQRVAGAYADVVSGDLTGTVNLVGLSGSMAAGQTLWMTGANLVAGDWIGSVIPELDGLGNLLPGYSWSGVPNASNSIRSLTTIEALYTGTIEHIFCRYSENFGATWQTASLTGPATVGGYGVIQHDGSTLKIESSRALMIRDLVVYDTALTDGQVQQVMLAIEKGAFGKGSTDNQMSIGLGIRL